MVKLLPARRLEVPQRSPITMASSLVSLRAPSWNSYRLRNEEWQNQAWVYYDLIGELHFIANYIGSACSRVRIFVADIDQYGRIGNETENPEIQAVADTLFSGPAAKSEALRSIGINLTVVGECFVVGKSYQAAKDSWHILSPSELRPRGNQIIVNFGEGLKEVLSPGRDIAIRVWTPHPKMPWCADSPTRSALLVLREIEQLTKFVFSQIDSRLSGAGLLVIPAGMDFPQSPQDASAVESFIQLLGEAMSASMQQDGTAKSVVPVVVERPTGAGEDNKFEFFKFDSDLSEQAKELRDEATRRLALSMDIPPEILSGTGETNHWSAWHIEESAVKIHVEPMMTRICDALTEAYLKPILRITGENPTAYTFWYDTSPLTVRPNRLQDTLNLFNEGIVSGKEVLVAGAYNPNTAAPTEEEDVRRFMRELVLRDPTLFTVPEVRELLGVFVEVATPPMEQAPGPPPPPSPEQLPTEPEPPAIPERSGEGTSATETDLLASGELVPSASTVLVAADLLVHRALELAGKRLHKSRDKDRWGHVPSHELHTFIKVRDRMHAERLLMGAWEHLAVLTNDLDVDHETLRHLLHRYCTELLVRSMAHNRSWLALALNRGGLLNG